MFTQTFHSRWIFPQSIGFSGQSFFLGILSYSHSLNPTYMVKGDSLCQPFTLKEYCEQTSLPGVNSGKQVKCNILHNIEQRLAQVDTGIFLSGFCYMVLHTLGWPQTWYVVGDDLNSWSSCIQHPSSGITGMHHHTGFIHCWGMNPGPGSE